jgi:hypothetical protein
MSLANLHEEYCTVLDTAAVLSTASIGTIR